MLTRRAERESALLRGTAFSEHSAGHQTMYTARPSTSITPKTHVCCVTQFRNTKADGGITADYDDSVHRSRCTLHAEKRG
jgi:hypothetical protein